MDWRKCVIVIGLIAIFIMGIHLAWTISNVLLMNELNGEYDVSSLRWAIIGALGSWAGSIFGAIALVISILAFWQPQRVNIQASINTAIMMNTILDKDIKAYVITVKNIGLRSVTVKNVYLNFGGKKNGIFFVGMLNEGSVLQAFTVKFPRKLEPGESFDYYLLMDKLDDALKHYEEKTPRKTAFYICVDEVIKGNMYFKTQWTLEDFVGGDN